MKAGSSSAVVEPGTVLDFTDHTAEVLATPDETGDRYRLTVVAERGGGPGITGAGPHRHPGAVETFSCVSGEMTVLVGRTTRTVRPGEQVVVPAGAIHGFVGSSDEPLVVDIEIIFTPPGPRLPADPVAFATTYLELVAGGRVSPRTGEPHLLQLAVLLRDYREAVSQPGMLGLMLRLLAPIGRIRGYRSGIADRAK